MRRWLVILGLACVGLGILTPVYISLVLEAASSLGAGLLWMALLAASLVVGIAAWLLAVPEAGRRGMVIARSFGLAAASLVLLLQVYLLADITYASWIGPKAMVTLPDGYAGMIGIYIHDVTEPGWHTAKKTYEYRVPPSGALETASGWIGLSFHFERDGTVKPGPYLTRISWENGTPLRHSEFACTWVQDQWMEQMLDYAWQSRSRTLGIACRIKPGGERDLKLSHVEAEQFFRDHFVLQGMRGDSLRRDTSRQRPPRTTDSTRAE